jgi:hypothetical protein
VSLWSAYVGYVSGVCLWSMPLGYLYWLSILGSHLGLADLRAGRVRHAKPDALLPDVAIPL